MEQGYNTTIVENFPDASTIIVDECAVGFTIDDKSNITIFFSFIGVHKERKIYFMIR